MKTQQFHTYAIFAGAFLALIGVNSVHAQKQTPADPALNPATHAKHVAADTPPDATSDPATKSDAALTQQLAQLQAKLAQLEAAMAKNMPPMAQQPAADPMPGMSTMPGPAPAMAAPPTMNMMGMMDKMMGMGAGAPMPPASGMGMDVMKMDAMPSATPTAGMSMDMGMMDMMGMGGGSMAAMPQSALPGFPGASHLYHLGATGFFLDHPQHISLTTEQQTGLNKAKEQAILAKNTSDREIEQAEQTLWTLTAADQPDAAKIEAKSARLKSYVAMGALPLFTPSATQASF